MKRGEIWWVTFDPSVGGETQKRRPAVIVSNDAANQYLSNRAGTLSVGDMERVNQAIATQLEI